MKRRSVGGLFQHPLPISLIDLGSANSLLFFFNREGGKTVPAPAHPVPRGQHTVTTSVRFVKLSNFGKTRNLRVRGAAGLTATLGVPQGRFFPGLLAEI